MSYRPYTYRLPKRSRIEKFFDKLAATRFGKWTGRQVDRLLTALERRKWLKWVLLIFGAYVFAAVISLITAIPLMFLWNWLMPHIFGLVTINLWEAWGLAWIAAILIKPPSVTFGSKS